MYESICEKELPADKDQHILKDELIRLTGTRAAKVEIDMVTLRRIVVYDSEKDVQLGTHYSRVEMGCIHYCSLIQSQMGCGNIFQATEAKFAGKNMYRHK